MKSTAEKAYAKVNLSLDVLSKLPDGYHEMRMIMQTVSLCDEVVVAVRGGTGKIAVRTDRVYIPSGESNIAGKAARVFTNRCGIADTDVEIVIRKNIPVCAGLGGGSADAAAVLRAMNELCGTGCTRAQLEQIGELIGADVPFCIAGGTSLAEGKGEKLLSLSPLPDCVFVICKPDFSVSTPELFSRIRCEKIVLRPDTDGMARALRAGNIGEISRRMYNVFEDVLPQRNEQIRNIKNIMLDGGASGAAMSGTGSAVFGVFTSDQKADETRKALSALYADVFTARPVPDNGI